MVNNTIIHNTSSVKYNTLVNRVQSIHYTTPRVNIYSIQTIQNTSNNCTIQYETLVIVISIQYNIQHK